MQEFYELERNHCAMVGVFTPETLVNATNQVFVFVVVAVIIVA